MAAPSPSAQTDDLRGSRQTLNPPESDQQRQLARFPAEVGSHGALGDPEDSGHGPDAWARVQAVGDRLFYHGVQQGA